MTILDPRKVVFTAEPGGFLSLKLGDGKQYRKVECIALFPLSQPDTFIVINGVLDKKTEEIGIIKELSHLPPDQRDLVKNEIEFRYLAPEITDIKKMTAKFGMEEWDVDTNRGSRTIFIQNIKENVTIRYDQLVMITDIEKCRYLVPDYRNLPPAARDLLELKLV
jgi:hypothetical protein